jgi:hypothetical protein
MSDTIWALDPPVSSSTVSAVPALIFRIVFPGHITNSILIFQGTWISRIDYVSCDRFLRVPDLKSRIGTEVVVPRIKDAEIMRIPTRSSRFRLPKYSEELYMQGKSSCDCPSLLEPEAVSAGTIVLITKERTELFWSAVDMPSVMISTLFSGRCVERDRLAGSFACDKSFARLLN